jgi:uncharacterized protein (UPF0218 family)
MRHSARNDRLWRRQRQRAGRRPTLRQVVTIVDAQIKREFKIQDSANQAAKDLKKRYPNLQVKVYDTKTKRAEQIELAPA